MRKENTSVDEKIEDLDLLQPINFYYRKVGEKPPFSKRDNVAAFDEHWNEFCESNSLAKHEIFKKTLEDEATEATPAPLTTENCR